LIIKNTTDDVMMVVPTINGIPLRLENITFGLPGFKNSNFPLIGMNPYKTYIKPGQTIEINDFACNKLELSKAASVKDGFAGLISTISDYSGDMKLLFPLIDAAFRRTLTADQRALLADTTLKPDEKAYLDAAIISSKETYVKEILKMLSQGFDSSWRCEVVMKKPVIADGANSDALSNPMLGTIGFAVVKVTEPQRQDVTQLLRDFSYSTDRGGAMKSMGGGGAMGGLGLGTIGGGAGYAGVALKSDWKHTDGIHAFQGYVPLNLASLR
jgi:hypothetical protein